nr:hypothetical protein BaRGS_025147 [Batillaria attramentaria]
MMMMMMTTTTTTTTTMMMMMVMVKIYYTRTETKVHGDPHLTTFGGGSHKVRIQFPCLYRLARFVADNGKTGRRGHVTCDVDVRAWNVVVESGRYFVAGLDVRLVLTKTANGRFQTVEVVMTGTGGLDSNGSAVYTLHCEANNMDISPSGHTLLKKWGGVSVWCHVDRDDNLLVLYIPACCTRITYRPHNADQILAPQTQIPGVVITAPVAAVWDTASVPLSMCGTPDDREDLEQTYILHAALTQGILPQDLNSNGYSSSCQQGIEDYTNCPDHLRDSALSLCGDILSRRRLLHCQLQQDPALDIMDNFAKCLRFLCVMLLSSH